MTGAEIALELEKRKGSKPSPGTIYPVLKDLKDKGLLSVDENKRYSLTKRGKKELEIHGVGYRATLESENKLILNLGFSHPVEIFAPQGIRFESKKNLITISGADKQLVGEIASKIRAIRPPEPYKGKGIRYKDEHVRRKVGKAVAKTEGEE